jgi:hypothetical protein
MGCVYYASDANNCHIFTQAYVGITKKKDIVERERYHRAKSKWCHADVRFVTIFAGPWEGCQWLERQLRPRCNIGWNEAKGGTSKAGPPQQFDGFTDTEFKDSIIKVLVRQTLISCLQQWVEWRRRPFQNTVQPFQDAVGPHLMERINEKEQTERTLQMIRNIEEIEAIDRAFRPYLKHAGCEGLRMVVGTLTAARHGRPPAVVHQENGDLELIGKSMARMIGRVVAPHGTAQDKARRRRQREDQKTAIRLRNHNKPVTPPWFAENIGSVDRWTGSDV